MPGKGDRALPPAEGTQEVMGAKPGPGRPGTLEGSEALGGFVACDQGPCESQAPPPRVPDHPPEGTARVPAVLAHAVEARRGALGPEEVRRRTAAVEGLRGDQSP